MWAKSLLKLWKALLPPLVLLAAMTEAGTGAAIVCMLYFLQLGITNESTKVSTIDADEGGEREGGE